MITGLYAGLLGLVYIVLTFLTIKGRFKHHISLGDGNNQDMAKRIRAHANFIEYVPFVLILLSILEYQGISGVFIHSLGIFLLAGRIFHALALYEISLIPMSRQIGMALTLLSIVLGSIGCISAYVL